MMGATFAENLLIGLQTAVSLENLLYCLIGVTVGTFVGVIPGIGSLAAMSMLFPITLYLDPTTAVIMLAGIWYGSTYGGSTASILLNLPGTPANAVACLDGYPMAQQGRAGVALLMTSVASFFGASIGISLMLVFTEPLARVAVSFGSPEYFSLLVLGLIAAGVISEGSPLKGIGMIILGVLIGGAGLDIYSGQQRFTFGLLELMDGVSLVALAMGLFGVSEVIASVRANNAHVLKHKITLRSMLPRPNELRRSWLPMFRGSGIGAFVGIMPGVGPTVAAFMSYSLERKVSSQPEKFGHGAIEGVTAPESANSSADMTSFIPTMAMGVPGSATMALILGVLMMHGITPGPNLITERPEMFWGLVVSFWIGNVLLLVLNIPMIGLWVRILHIPYHLLYPVVISFICIGVYTVSSSYVDVVLVGVFGLLGYVMRVLGFPAAPLLLGFVLGPMLEEHFRRAMIISRGDFGIFFTRPISLAFLSVAATFILWVCIKSIRARLRASPAGAQPAPKAD